MSVAVNGDSAQVQYWFCFLKQGAVALESFEPVNVKPEPRGQRLTAANVSMDLSQSTLWKDTTFPVCMFAPALPYFLFPSVLPTRWRWPKSSAVTEAQSVAPGETTDRVTLLGFLFKLEGGRGRRWEEETLRTYWGTLLCGIQEGGGVGQAGVFWDKKWMHSMLSTGTK